MGKEREGFRPTLYIHRSHAKRGTELRIKAGLLTDRSSQTRHLPVLGRTVAFAGPLAAHSGATVREFHPLPFSLAPRREHLEALA
jgi:hypothetical protein